MNKICKILLAAAAVTALAAPAMAADKLIVKNAAGTADVFKVDDVGTVLGAKLGMGTSAPVTPIHLNLGTQPVGTLLYSTASGFTGSTQNNSMQLDLTVADSSAIAGLRGAIRGVRSRGSLEVPAAAASGDLVLSVIGGVYDGAVVRNTADINFTVDGTVASNVAPQRISFRTRTNGAGAYFERFTIKHDGKLLVDPTAMPVYADNAAATAGGLVAGSLYRTSTGVIMMRY